MKATVEEAPCPPVGVTRCVTGPVPVAVTGSSSVSWHLLGGCQSETTPDRKYLLHKLNLIYLPLLQILQLNLQTPLPLRLLPAEVLAPVMADVEEALKKIVGATRCARTGRIAAVTGRSSVPSHL